MTDAKDPFSEVSADEVKIVEPDFSLKQKIGDANLKEIFSPQNVEKAQGVIDQHKESFLEWVTKDIEALEDAYKACAATKKQEDVQKLGKAAFVIKSQAGTFGYGLASKVAKSLDDFCSQHPAPSSEQLLVIRKHIDALQSIFQNKLAGDGSTLGDSLLQQLQKLVAKFN